ncbi:hypothetical protein LCGC14_2399500 [marine sediment metagenome]|uniref:Multidrug resistance protein MdtA-like barrel-sandwich hybrid domain-containing protein n=1 Tax=marine sediment metagenome TaxID=412755 RepID=A0A0F9E839_9ZZZZ
MRVSITGLSVLLVVAGLPVTASAQSSTDPIRCQVALIDEVQVPAREEGVLKELLVQEGDLVVLDQLLARIDDDRAQMLLTSAKLKLKVAQKQAENTTNVEYAEAASAVAKAEWIQSHEANQKVPGAVTMAEMRRLVLTFHRTEWEIKQAEEDLIIAGLQAQVSEAERDAAADNLERRKVLSPLEGEVVQRHRQKGEWIKAGEPVLDIVRLNKLRVEGFLPASNYTPGEIRGRPVTVTVILTRNRAEQFTGQIVFVSPLVVQGGKRFVRAEVENRKEDGEWLLSSGWPAEMTINDIVVKQR